MSFSPCCCYGFLSTTPKPLPDSHRREVIHGDALKWLYQLGPKGFPEKACVVTSLPDWSEMKKGQNMSLKEYLEWFKKAHGALQFLDIKTIKKTKQNAGKGGRGLRSNGRWYQNHGRCSVALKVNDKWWFGSYKALPKKWRLFQFQW